VSEWKITNIAAVTIWGYLGFQKEIYGTFTESKGIKVSEFAFWNPSATDAFNRIGAEALAKDIHHHFAMLLESTYENEEMTYAKALKSLTSVLSNKDKTLEDFSTALDALFKVPGEE
jgi:hypothetical protein